MNLCQIWLSFCTTKCTLRDNISVLFTSVAVLRDPLYVSLFCYLLCSHSKTTHDNHLGSVERSSKVTGSEQGSGGKSTTTTLPATCVVVVAPPKKPYYLLPHLVGGPPQIACNTSAHNVVIHT